MIESAAPTGAGPVAEPVYVVTCEQWYAYNWSVKAAFPTLDAAARYCWADDLTADLRIYRCDASGCTDVRMPECPDCGGSRRVPAEDGASYWCRTCNHDRRRLMP